MKLFSLLIAVAAMSAVYVLSSFPVPAFAEQLVFTSQAAADAAAPLSPSTVVEIIVTLLAAVVVLMVVFELMKHRRRSRPAIAEFNGGYDDDAYHLDAGIPRIRDPSPSG